jgi:hypothetical protein
MKDDISASDDAIGKIEVAVSGAGDKCDLHKDSLCLL